MTTAEESRRAPALQWVSPPTPSANLRPLDPSKAEVATDRFNSARVCGACHQEIFQEWSRSMHALSYTGPAFKAAFLEAYHRAGGEAAQLCLRCHSPTVAETEDLFGKQELTREGVTCDYCHSIASITVEDPRGQMRHTIEHWTRYGPSAIPSSSAHEVEPRPYFERSEICAGCHDYTTADGTSVLATYAEWRASKYAERGTQCQDCHMLPSVSAAAARAGQAVFSNHDFQCGSSSPLIEKAVVVRVEDVRRDADRVRVVVAVENSGAGHSIPTGLPSRKLALVASATQQGREVFRRETVYRRVMLGDDRQPLTKDWEIKLLSKGVLRDNRIRSGEVRRETFVFDASPYDDIVFRVRVAYRYQPQAPGKRTSEIPLAEIEKIIATRK